MSERPQEPAHRKPLEEEDGGCTCLLCGTVASMHQGRCSRCRAVTSLEDPERLIDNDEADPIALSRLVDRLESLEGEAVGYDLHFVLGLAYVNLKRFYEGLTRLRVASQLRPLDRTLHQRVGALSRHLQTRRRNPPVAVHKEPSPTRRVVLVVDDSPTLRKIVAVTLEPAGYRVVTAADGLQALAKLDRVRPDLVLLDVHLPYVDGFRVCRMIKRCAGKRGVPVVMISGDRSWLARLRGRLAGAACFLAKPFQPGELVEMVGRLASRSTVMAR